MSETLQAGLSLTRKYDIDAARTIAFMGDECRVYSTPALLYDIDLDDSLTTQTLTELHPYVLLPDGHPLADQHEIAPHELAEEPMILLDNSPSRDYFLGLMAEAGVTPNVRHRTQSLEMARGMVGHGLGYAILSTKPASPMTYDGMRVVVRPLTGPQETSRVVLAHRRGHRLSPAAERFALECWSQFTAGES